jgi:hypothetical protein
VLADGVVAGKKLIYELLADNDVMVVVEALMFGEDAAAQQRNLHDAEVLRVGGQGHGIVLKAVTGCGRSRMVKTLSPWGPVPGAAETSAAPRTPGSRRTRSSSDWWKSITLSRVSYWISGRPNFMVIT